MMIWVIFAIILTNPNSNSNPYSNPNSYPYRNPDGCYTAVKLIAELSVMRRLQADKLVDTG
jgi:hypothetical protein